MISIIGTVFTEYTDAQKAVIKSAQGIKSFPGIKNQSIGKMMLKKAANADFKQRGALVHGAKKLLR